MRQASTRSGKETESLPKERYEKGVVVRLCTKSIRKLEGEPMYYRGIKHTPQDVAKEQKVVSAGIYRGIRHDAIESESKKTSTTVYPKWYRGVRHA